MGRRVGHGWRKGDEDSKHRSRRNSTQTESYNYETYHPPVSSLSFLTTK